MRTKVCSKCGEEQPLENFSKSKRSKDGLMAWCKECVRQYNQEHKDEIAVKNRQYRDKHKDEIAEIRHRYWVKHKEELTKYNKQYYIEHKKEIGEYKKSPMGRAINLLCAYNHGDQKYNRGEGDLTAKWIVENIFAKPCVHCGETDWHKIGCNRLDNSKPHTKDNVEPCCWECNNKLAAAEKRKKIELCRDIKEILTRTNS